ERLGAVNTVVIGEGWTKGHNTDVFGFRLSLRSLGLRVGDRRVLVVGAGGAAKAVVDVLVREGAKVQVTNRTTRRADVLADSFDESVEAIPLDSLARGGPWDLLVNATPLGTREAGPGLPVPASILPKVAHVYDLVYNPPTTPLLEAARRLGKPTTSGLEMLLHQAAQSFELWTGRAPPVEPMRRAAKEALGRSPRRPVSASWISCSSGDSCERCRDRAVARRDCGRRSGDCGPRGQATAPGGAARCGEEAGWPPRRRRGHGGSGIHAAPDRRCDEGDQPLLCRGPGAALDRREPARPGPRPPSEVGEAEDPRGRGRGPDGPL